MSRIDESIAEVRNSEHMTDDEKHSSIGRLHQLKHTYQKLVDERNITLRVDVTTLDQAQELYDWLYVKPEKDVSVSCQLTSIAWDSEVISGDEAKLMRHIRNFVGGYDGEISPPDGVSDVITEIRTQLSNIEYLDTDVAQSIIKDMLGDTIQKLENL